MHLLCRDPECPGHELPAGEPADERCRYCGTLLTDGDGNVLAQGPDPLARPEGLDPLVEALRGAGVDVRVVELTAVRDGDLLLVSAVEDGELTDVKLLEGSRAREAEHEMGLLGG